MRFETLMNADFLSYLRESASKLPSTLWLNHPILYEVLYGSTLFWR